MATAREPVTGNSTPFLKNHSISKLPSSKDCPVPLRRHTDNVSRTSTNGAEAGRSGLEGCACVETGNLPRIVLISNGDGLMSGLGKALDPCPLEIRYLKSCREAGQEIRRCTTADVIFSDTHLPDGDWTQVLRTVRQTSARAEVIVVCRFADVDLYLDSLEAGAFDFVVPPFHTVELGYIIVNAIYACFKQRYHGM